MIKSAKKSLRRSCNFCRTRKIRCSGQRICDACRERGIDCTYDFEFPRRRSVEPSAPAAPISLPSTPKSTSEGNIAADLDEDFAASFANEKYTSSTPRARLGINGVLPLVVQDLVNSVSVKVGCFGSQNSAEGGNLYYTRSISSDPTTTMFDPPRPNLEAHILQDDRRNSQMIQTWFSVHPLTVIVSKTLLLRSLRDKSVDDALLAAIIGTAYLAHDDTDSRRKGESMIAWAAAQLRHRSSSATNLSTVQLLLILGWYELCSGSFRRAVCYIRLAGRLVGQIDRTSSEATEALSTVNGVSVPKLTSAKVETELLAYAWWTSFALSLWAFMQNGRSSVRFLHSFMPLNLLPIDSAGSIVIALDELSGNISTLPVQRRMIKEFWPLSCIASSAAHNFSLLPQIIEVDHSGAYLDWQDRLMHHYNRLARTVHSQDTRDLCKRVRRVVTDCVSLMKEKISSADTLELVLTAFYTILLHAIFPSNRNMVAEDTVKQMLGQFLHISNSLGDMIARSQDPQSGAEKTVWRVCLVEMQAQAIDACSRGLDFFRLIMQERPNQARIISGQMDKLITTTDYLYHIIRDKIDAPSRSLRSVKRRLKTSRLFYQACVRDSGLLGPPKAYHQKEFPPASSAESYQGTRDELLSLSATNHYRDPLVSTTDSHADSPPPLSFDHFDVLTGPTSSTNPTSTFNTPPGDHAVDDLALDLFDFRSLAVVGGTAMGESGLMAQHGQVEGLLGLFDWRHDPVPSFDLSYGIGAPKSMAIPISGEGPGLNAGPDSDIGYQRVGETKRRRPNQYNALH
ncbi:uncharacterized protein K452DRAFT_362971 [Aplosporella prunicola CBS 121167]|uniref:Zn(2)-C6 fungal-type domain-containing protein n=1 Tax=Aplosporella prunicola CBS 121167 TaxID=1176127 RepID=A0A6A6AY97_9PEZI|nr:uncharacterized protein K452DRAFT_362971 [Aplosporella prunicola CBS 121167]KAF2135747.1 hypothetical protein K452DRAFT_362971 [Aplosporella prunicola CBS 121167]